MDAKVLGTTMPVLEVVLNPGEAIVAESGELSWMTKAIQMRTTTSAAGGGGGGGIFKRGMGGATFWMTEYTARDEPGMVAFAARAPGQIFPVDVQPGAGTGFLGHRHAFICGTPEVELTFGFQRKLGAGFFGGEGFRLQKITGQGRAWVEMSGEVVSYDLRDGEEIRVHPGHVGLFQDSVEFSISTVPGIRNKLFGNEGLFLAKLTGPGRIWLQSLPLARLAHVIGEYIAVDAALTGSVAGAAGGAAAGSPRGNAFIRGMLGRP